MSPPRRLPVTDPHWARLLAVKDTVNAEQHARGLGEATWFDVMAALLDAWDNRHEAMA